ncbi:hypothetical protein N7520_001151 [Penicillium odoratum]|uniref:uncharacterized protein n=1 Tax=Penicillium odoratum TaxID=1167516 RepID=UPI002546D7D4|nr:uncharacterized protein N7520_001151 [Penicillium odoratum]KAJ5777905.1 hypothetical protein N7520_001151 [Penicillium odoratum]
MKKVCFVTVGATAPFPDLIRAVTQVQFLEKLGKNNFTQLIIQHGTYGRVELETFLATHGDSDGRIHGVRMSGFAFTSDVDYYMHLATERRKDGQELGLVISHAGTGTILEAMRCGAPLVIVPNPALANNHQQELAMQMENLGYGVMSWAEDIISAVDKATEQLVKRCSAIEDTGEVDVKNAMRDQLSYVD